MRRLRTKEDVILGMAFWPELPFSEAELTDEGREILKDEKLHWKGISLWLQYYELGRRELESFLFDTPVIRLKPFADRSLALRSFCQQHWLRCTWKHETDIEGHDELWGCCEYSFSQFRLRSAGLTGRPEPQEINEHGRVKGKSERIRESQQTIALVRASFESGQPLAEKYSPEEEFDVRLWLSALILAEGIEIARSNKDSDLEFHIEQFLGAHSHFNRTLKEGGNYQFRRLSVKDDVVKSTGKSKKTSRSEPPTEPRRGRGRPPKGQEKARIRKA